MMRRSGGFTLMEMLLGMALLGLLTLALFSALRFGTQSWERAEAKAAQVVDLAIVETVLRREVAKAFPLRVGQANENKIAFEGDAEGLKFFTALPAHFSTGGLSLVELRHVRGSGEANAGGDLMLRHALQNGFETELPSGDDTKESRLLRGVTKVRFDYYGRETDFIEPAWTAVWVQSARMPQLVRLTFQLVGSDEDRELVLPLRVGEEAGCYQAAFQRQCGPRR